MKNETKEFIKLWWAIDGKLLVGSALAIAGGILAMNGAYWRGACTLLDGMANIDLEKTKEIIAKTEK